MKIRIFTTGGTFDKEYDLINEKFFFKKSQVPEMLELARSTLDLKVQKIMMIDSLFMTDKDREKIVTACKKAKEDKIVITHGTGTMSETGQFLAERIKNKTIVLTGAMIPYKLVHSDALFNLGTALAFVQTLPQGIYLSMNGLYFSPKKVRKNTKIGKFETIK